MSVALLHRRRLRRNEVLREPAGCLPGLRSTLHFTDATSRQGDALLGDTFIISEREKRGGYDVRVFTPDFELPFAGHPTIGTAYIIQSQIINKPVPVVRLNLKVGQIPVTFSYRKGLPDILWMRQKTPIFGGVFKVSDVAKLLNVDESDIDSRFPIMQVSTGIAFVIVPLKSLDAIRRIRLDVAASSTFLGKVKAIAFLVFSPETYSKENDLNVRVLGPAPSIPEDPATGSGNGCLAAYLVRTRYFGKDRVDTKNEQGYEIDRRSRLLLKAFAKGSAIEVNVGGRVQFIASGKFEAP